MELLPNAIKLSFTVDFVLKVSMLDTYYLETSLRGKKITCPCARDKLNFRQDKHIFSPNVRRTSTKFTDGLFFLDKDKLFGNRTSENFGVLAQRTSENF